MSSVLLIAALVAAVALTFWRPLRRVRTALGVDHLLSTGHAFMLLGALLGVAFGERSAAPLLADLAPVVAFFAGWVGFAAGMRFDLRVLRPVPARAYWVALVPAVCAALSVGLVSFGALYLARAPRAELWTGSLVLAAAAASSGPTLAAVLRTRRAGRAYESRATLRMIEFAAGLDDVVVAAVAMVAFGFFRTVVEPVGPAFIAGAAVACGAAIGVVIWLFLGGRAREDERLLLGLGMLAFAAGFAGWLNLPPVAIAAIAATVLVNLPGDRMTQLAHAVRRVERPAVVILMTLIGLHSIGPVSWVVAPLAVAMTLVRLAAKAWSGDAVAGPIAGASGLGASPKWGLGLAPQGTFGLIVVLSFYYLHGDELTRSVLAAAALASLLNELMAPWLLLGVLRRLIVPPSRRTSRVSA